MRLNICVANKWVSVWERKKGKTNWADDQNYNCHLNGFRSRATYKEPHIKSHKKRNKWYIQTKIFKLFPLCFVRIFASKPMSDLAFQKFYHTEWYNTIVLHCEFDSLELSVHSHAISTMIVLFFCVLYPHSSVVGHFGKLTFIDYWSSLIDDLNLLTFQ